MGELVYGCITPHGGEIIPELAGDKPERMGETRSALKTIGERMNEQAPDAIIIFTPHGTRMEGGFTIIDSETMEGSFSENGRTYSMSRPVHRSLARAIKENAESRNLPVGRLNFGTSEGPLSVLPLDWGAIVPLRFMKPVPIVVITPSRSLSYEQMIAFGKAVRQTIESVEARVGVIASCDWSHTHDEAGPYGFHTQAKRLDEKVVEMIKSNDLEDVQSFTEQEIDEAKPDGIWQTLMLSGVMTKEERAVNFLTYEAPTYFGLICAEVTLKDR